MFVDCFGCAKINQSALFAFDTRAHSVRLLAPPISYDRAGSVDDMCVAGDTVFVRGNFKVLERCVSSFSFECFPLQTVKPPRRERRFESPLGSVTWNPGENQWKSVPLEGKRKCSSSCFL